MPVRRVLPSALLLVVACETSTPQLATREPAAAVATPDSPRTEPTPPKPDPATPPGLEELPSPAPPLSAAELKGPASCGPFELDRLDKKDRPLLEDRLRARFFAGARVTGDTETARIQVEREGSTLFIGAREVYAVGDDRFERRATKSARFGGDYDAATVPARGVAIVAGFARAPEPGADMFALAHGWFLDADRNVLDVAVFVSGDVPDMAACRRFAHGLLATVAPGPRRLAASTGGETVTTVSYAKFRYRLPPGWTMTSSVGIHDFARIHFRKRGTFPDGVTSLQLALDSHPGEWGSAGEPAGERKGKLLGLAVTWNLTKAPTTSGAWTISADTDGHDHAVASIMANDDRDRDAAIAFAESIVVDP